MNFESTLLTRVMRWHLDTCPHLHLLLTVSSAPDHLTDTIASILFGQKFRALVGSYRSTSNVERASRDGSFPSGGSAMAVPNGFGSMVGHSPEQAGSRQGSLAESGDLSVPLEEALAKLQEKYISQLQGIVKSYVASKQGGMVTTEMQESYKHSLQSCIDTFASKVDHQTDLHIKAAVQKANNGLQTITAASRDHLASLETRLHFQCEGAKNEAEVVGLKRDHFKATQDHQKGLEDKLQHLRKSQSAETLHLQSLQEMAKAQLQLALNTMQMSLGTSSVAGTSGGLMPSRQSMYGKGDLLVCSPEVEDGVSIADRRLTPPSAPEAPPQSPTKRSPYDRAKTIIAKELPKIPSRPSVQQAAAAVPGGIDPQQFQKQMQMAAQQAFQQGQSVGFSSGFREGKTAGAEENYERGKADGLEVGTKKGYQDGVDHEAAKQLMMRMRYDQLMRADEKMREGVSGLMMNPDGLDEVELDGPDYVKRRDNDEVSKFIRHLVSTASIRNAEVMESVEQRNIEADQKLDPEDAYRSIVRFRVVMCGPKGSGKSSLAASLRNSGLDELNLPTRGLLKVLQYLQKHTGTDPNKVISPTIINPTFYHISSHLHEKQLSDLEDWWWHVCQANEGLGDLPRRVPLWGKIHWDIMDLCGALTPCLHSMPSCSFPAKGTAFVLCYDLSMPMELQVPEMEKIVHWVAAQPWRVLKDDLLAQDQSDKRFFTQQAIGVGVVLMGTHADLVSSLDVVHARMNFAKSWLSQLLEDLHPPTQTSRGDSKTTLWILGSFAVNTRTGTIKKLPGDSGPSDTHELVAFLIFVLQKIYPIHPKSLLPPVDDGQETVGYGRRRSVSLDLADEADFGIDRELLDEAWETGVRTLLVHLKSQCTWEWVISYFRLSKIIRSLLTGHGELSELYIEQVVRELECRGVLLTLPRLDHYKEDSYFNDAGGEVVKTRAVLLHPAWVMRLCCCLFGPMTISWLVQYYSNPARIAAEGEATLHALKKGTHDLPFDILDLKDEKVAGYDTASLYMSDKDARWRAGVLTASSTSVILAKCKEMMSEDSTLLVMRLLSLMGVCRTITVSLRISDADDPDSPWKMAQQQAALKQTQGYQEEDRTVVVLPGLLQHKTPALLQSLIPFLLSIYGPGVGHRYSFHGMPASFMSRLMVELIPLFQMDAPSTKAMWADGMLLVPQQLVGYRIFPPLKHSFALDAKTLSTNRQYMARGLLLLRGQEVSVLVTGPIVPSDVEAVLQIVHESIQNIMRYQFPNIKVECTKMQLKGTVSNSKEMKSKMLEIFAQHEVSPRVGEHIVSATFQRMKKVAAGSIDDNPVDGAVLSCLESLQEPT